jgi:hypothetical protein
MGVKSSPKEEAMKQIAIITAAALALSVGAAQAATQKKNVDKTAQLKASCEKQAAQKFSFFQFMQRRDFMKKCTGDKNA